MARPRTITDDVLLRIARSCFLEHGPAVSTTAIAEAVGLSQAALFKRFGSKQELMLQALLPPPEPAWLALLVAGPDARPIIEQLMEIGIAAGRFFEKMTPAMMTLKASGIDFAKVFCRYETPPPARALQLLTAWFQAAMDEGRIRQINPLNVAMSFMGAIHGLNFLQHVAGNWMPFPPLEQAVETHCDVLCLGLLPEEKTP